MGHSGHLLVSIFVFKLVAMSAETSAVAQAADDSGLCDVFTMHLDNDEMGGTDRH